MKKLVSASIATTLLSAAFSVTAGPKYQIQMDGADFLYDPNQLYEEIGTGGGGTPTETNVNYATLRDSEMNDWNGINGADGTFGDIKFGDQLGSLKLYEDTDGNGTYETLVETYSTQPIYLDFRMVLEAGQFVSQPALNDSNTYDLIEEYSFFDILTQDQTTDWGLALDADPANPATLTVFNSGAIQLVFTGISGSIFDDPNGGDTNNLPFSTFQEIDESDPISFSFSFQSITGLTPGTDWGVTEGSGTGEVLVTADIPEPRALGVLGLALTGMGFLQRRRKQY